MTKPIVPTYGSCSFLADRTRAILHHFEHMPFILAGVEHVWRRLSTALICADESSSVREITRSAPKRFKMPAEKEVPRAATTEYKGASSCSLPCTQYIEFAGRSLEELFLLYADKVADERDLAVPCPNARETKAGTNFTQNRDKAANGADISSDTQDRSNAPPRNSSPLFRVEPEMAPENSTANSQSSASRTDNAGGLPFYEQQRKKLQGLLKKRADLEHKLVGSPVTHLHLLIIVVPMRSC